MSKKKTGTKKKGTALPKIQPSLPDLQSIGQLMDSGDLQSAAHAIDVALPGAAAAAADLNSFKKVIKSALDLNAPIQRAAWQNREGEWEIADGAAGVSYDLLKGQLPKKRLIKCISFSITQLIQENAEHHKVSLEQSLEELRDLLHPYLVQKPPTKALIVSVTKELSKQQAVAIPPVAVPKNLSLPQAQTLAPSDDNSPSLQI